MCILFEGKDLKERRVNYQESSGGSLKNGRFDKDD